MPRINQWQRERNLEALLHNRTRDSNPEREKRAIVFRFSDLKEEAQKKFARLLKQDSSIHTLYSKAKENEIEEVLKTFDPILINGGNRGGWSGSTLFRWREKFISRIVYHTLFRELNTHQNWTLEYLQNRPAEPILGRDDPNLCQNNKVSAPNAGKRSTTSTSRQMSHNGEGKQAPLTWTEKTGTTQATSKWTMPEQTK